MSDKAKIWFFTDIHGSDSCFRKFLNSVNNSNKPNVLIIGADITGKQIVPIVEKENKTFVIPLSGRETPIKEKDIDDVKKKLADVGYYPYECNQIEYNNLSFDKKYQDEIFEKLAKERLKNWVALAERKLPSFEECKVIINAGNDDPFFVDEVLDTSTKMIRAEDKIIDLPAGLKMLSTGYSIKTPWDCPRDISEERLHAKIASMTSKLNKQDKLLFNFHCPPINSSLDLAIAIDEKTLKKKAGIGKSARIHVGSESVRKAIEFWQPIASLHGHIHEVHAKEYIGKSLCFNPGSDYQNGLLQGAFIQINTEGVIELETLTQEKHSTNGDNSFIDSLISLIPYIGNSFKNYKTSKKQEDLTKKLDEVDIRVQEILKKINE